jgi:hypothetical protein
VLRFDGKRGVKFEGVLGVVWARGQRGGRAGGGGRIEVPRVDEDLYCVCCGSIR